MRNGPGCQLPAEPRSGSLGLDILFYFVYDSLLLAPGGTINFVTGQLFIGAGIIKEIWLKSADVAIPLEMKLQVGIRASKYRLGAYMLTFFKEMFNDLSFGFTIGFAL